MKNNINLHYRSAFTSNKNWNHQNKEKKHDRLTQNKNDNNGKTKLYSLVGSFLGILSALALLTKIKHTQGKTLKNMFNLHLNEADALCLGVSTVGGGFLGGSIADKKNTKYKLREGIHQIIGNVATPLAFIALAQKTIQKSNIKVPMIKKNGPLVNFTNSTLSILPDLFAVTTGLIIGVDVGNRIANSVNKKIFNNHSDRKMDVKDFCIHIDDPISIVTFIDKTGKLKNITSKIFPFAHMLSGYEAGIAKK